MLRKLVIEAESIFKGKTSSEIEITCKLHYNYVVNEKFIQFYSGKKLIKEIPFRQYLERKQYMDYLLTQLLMQKRVF